VTWEKPILNGKRIKIHGRTMNESAIIYYLSTQETTMLLTGTLDITVFSCNYLTIMGTEYLIAWGMAYRSPSSERHPGCSLSAGFKPELSPPKEKKKKKNTASRIWYQVNLTVSKTVIKYLSEPGGVWNACSVLQM